MQPEKDPSIPFVENTTQTCEDLVCQLFRTVPVESRSNDDTMFLHFIDECGKDRGLAIANLIKLTPSSAALRLAGSSISR
jgi:hypothetical protein